MLDGKVALVTGGASGIGRASCQRLASAGAIVAVVDRDIEGASVVATELACGAVAFECDVGDPMSATQVVEKVVSHLGRLDVLANIAGVDDPIAKRAVIEAFATGRPLDVTMHLTDEQWRRVLSINLDGVFHMTRAALQVMQPRGTGAIINMASIAGVTGIAGLSHYSASKAGVIGFTRAVAREVADQGIRVNAIAPGVVDTPMAQRGADIRKAIGSPLPMGRPAAATEVADLVLFLASDQSAYITGETINVSGGAVIP
jgi:3-oxoacyl-[acyl-carrier protein] reductase